MDIRKSHNAIVEMAIADFFHCENIPDAVVEPPRFKRLVKVCRLVGDDFVPAFLISLLREVPVLIERTDDTVVCRCRSHFSGGRVGSRGRALVAKRATKVGENGRISSGFGEAASVKVVINCELKSN